VGILDIFKGKKKVAKQEAEKEAPITTDPLELEYLAVMQERNTIEAKLKNGEPRTPEFNKLLDDLKVVEKKETELRDLLNARLKAKQKLLTLRDYEIHGMPKDIDEASKSQGIKAARATLSQAAYLNVLNSDEIKNKTEKAAEYEYEVHHMKEDVGNAAKAVANQSAKIHQDAFVDFLNSDKGKKMSKEEIARQYEVYYIKDDAYDAIKNSKDKRKLTTQEAVNKMLDKIKEN